MFPLQGIYIGCTIFSAGVTILDFLGFLSREDSSNSHSDNGGSHDSHDSDDATSHHDHHDHQAHQAHHGGGVAVLSALFFLRSLVYFCLGFGPTGWVAIASGRSTAVSLIWAVPVGAVALILARLFFRFQGHDTDSSLTKQELLFQRGAIVIIPISPNNMGKIRLKVGMNVAELYALPAKPNEEFKKGDRVWITETSDDCVYVEKDVIGDAGKEE